MSDTPNRFPIEKSHETVRQEVLTNIVKMLVYRGTIDNDKKDDIINSLVSNVTDDQVYSIPLKSGDNHMIKLVNQKVTTLNNAYGLKDFLMKYKDDQSIIIVKEINKKAIDQLKRHHPTSQYFKEGEMMINLSEHILFNDHEKVIDHNKPEQLEEFMKIYNIPSKKRIPRIHESDMAARHLNLKRDDVCRILRPSETGGYVVSYRIVIP